jgi:hypothetical protein
MQGKKDSHPKTVVSVIVQSGWPGNKIICMTKLVQYPDYNLQAAIYRMRTSNRLHIPLDWVVPTLNHFHYNALQVGLHELDFHSFQPRYQPPDRPKKH